MGVIQKAVDKKRRYKMRVMKEKFKHEKEMVGAHDRLDRIKTRESGKTQRSAAWAAAVSKATSDSAQAKIEQAQQLTARTKEIEATKRAIIQYNSLMNGNQNNLDAKGENNASNENETKNSNSDLWV